MLLVVVELNSLGLGHQMDLFHYLFLPDHTVKSSHEEVHSQILIIKLSNNLSNLNANHLKLGIKLRLYLLHLDQHLLLAIAKYSEGEGELVYLVICV